jgi:hypothetical protein
MMKKEEEKKWRYGYSQRRVEGCEEKERWSGSMRKQWLRRAPLMRMTLELLSSLTDSTKKV